MRPGRPRWLGAVRRAWPRVLLGAACTWLVAWGGERALDVAFPYPLDRLDQLGHSTVLTAADGSWLQVWPTAAGERVLETRWDQLPADLRAAILTSEDRAFFEHSGVDVGAVARALWQNITSGRVVSGASTLTMQVVRIVEPRPRTLWSKVVEAFRARQLERAVDKRRILDLWVTQVPMGGTLRGMDAAARYWFGRPAAELGTHEAAMLVAMVPAPSARAPHRHPDLLRDRRDALLSRMAADGALSVDAARRARVRSLGAAPHAWPQHAWHLCAAELAATPSPTPPVLATVADLGLQDRLEALVAARRDLPGDGLAIVVIDRTDAGLRALVGSRSGRPGALDVSRCRRSVGSTLKPFLFALALEQGAVHDASLLDDAPLELDGWRPANFGGEHAGRTRPADALATSANLPAIRCLARAGVEPFHRLLAQLGLPVDVDGLQLDAALGTVAAAPIELARAYQRFVEHPAEVGLSQRSVDWTLRAMARLPVDRAHAIAGRLAWKSGTSSGCRDAWCVGVTDDRVVVVWIGNLTGRGETDLVGARTAAALLGEVVARI